ncbi:MAG TPA: HNH endonuclease [Pyrinomonadaceae bacterium]|jgi:5-methylcytosine-specific restriction endonuclease McrA
MNTKICKNCQLEKPLQMFAVKRGDFWSYAERCRPCRKLAKPFQRFWKPLSPEICERNKMTRRARLAGASVIIPFTKAEIIRRDGLNCYLCGKLLTYKSATIDHVIPLSRGGYHAPSNAKIACFPCNRAKYNKNLQEFLNG